MQHKTRIAPTPSGYLHIGNLYSFAVTCLLARHQKASILLRIDDLDSQRMRKEYIDDIFATLDFAGIAADEGPSGTGDFLKNHSQHTRLHLYAKHLENLAEKNLVYACSCSRKDLSSFSSGYTGLCREKNHPLGGQDLSWRLATGCRSAVYHELFWGTQRAELPPQMREPVVRKKDGLPSYQLASVIDDQHFSVDLVVRGEDLLPSTLAQQVIAEALGLEIFSKTAFFHHRIITDKGGKLSKSQDAPSVRKQFSSRSELLSAVACMMGLDAKIASLDELYDSACVHNLFETLSVLYRSNP